MKTKFSESWILERETGVPRDEAKLEGSRAWKKLKLVRSKAKSRS